MPPLPLILLVVFTTQVVDSYDVLCFIQFDEKTLQCEDFLGEGISQEDCCLNKKYGFRKDHDSPCQSCHSSHWSVWGSWSPCSVTCSEGVQDRRRTCIGHGFCPGKHLEVRSCSEHECCTVMGGWSSWTLWSTCSVTCGKGQRRRSRLCDNPTPSCGGSCIGESSQVDLCDTHQVCPTHGAWGHWGPWNPCSSHCRKEDGPGIVPVQSRLRECNNPKPSVFPPGNPCRGNAKEERACPDLPPCPVDGSWGSWKRDPGCTVTCGIGRIREERSCDSPAPQHGGKDCPGSPYQSAICNTKIPCPVNGTWSEWSPWGLCSSGCGTSNRTRSRECQPVYPDYPNMVQGATKMVEVVFTGTPLVTCDPINGQTQKVEETAACRNLPPCT
ncbi:properdin-like isoform X2 [Engystomops pustulosus]|uniref:properdin-like isoform X2 n=1 Tax=Engystomops pustulosus TaxID=76066 RepID=UPI003AFA2FD5